jgi:uncharacterized protein (DUF1697 family)
MSPPSTRYIALLRGINVGGHTVKMDRLRDLFADLGFTNIRTYIQTGNVFFESDKTDELALRKKIEAHLEKTLGYGVPTCLRTIESLEKLVKLDPFKRIELTPDCRFAVNFLAEPAKIDLPVPYTTPDGGYELVGKTPTELFIVWHLKNGRPSNSYGLLEKKVQVPTTTRFWHTTAKILTAAKQK